MWRLPCESVNGFHVFSEVRRKQFDRDIAMQLDVVTQHTFTQDDAGFLYDGISFQPHEVSEAGRRGKAAQAGRLRLGTPDVWLTSVMTGHDVHVTDPGPPRCLPRAAR